MIPHLMHAQFQQWGASEQQSCNLWYLRAIGGFISETGPNCSHGLGQLRNYLSSGRDEQQNIH
jgi:hypothetical protein